MTCVCRNFILLWYHKLFKLFSKVSVFKSATMCINRLQNICKSTLICWFSCWVTVQRSTYFSLCRCLTCLLLLSGWSPSLPLSVHFFLLLKFCLKPKHSSVFMAEIFWQHFLMLLITCWHLSSWLLNSWWKIQKIWNNNYYQSDSYHILGRV